MSHSLNFWIANWKTKDSAPNDGKNSLNFDILFNVFPSPIYALAKV
jgi:hypothetical protein